MNVTTSLVKLIAGAAISLLAAQVSAEAPQASPTAPSKTAVPPLPFTLERFNLPGPVTGAVIKLDLTNPRVHVEVALADDRDPDGDGPCVGQLETPSMAARKLGYQLAVNASFFAVASPKEVDGRKISYYVGNCAYPVGWHYSGGKALTHPNGDKFRATLIVNREGRVSLKDNVKELPADTRFAVSGNAMMLTQGRVTITGNDEARHPRTALGLSADGKTFYIMVVDGRQEQSRGVTLAELAKIFQSYGADTAINLDGGGSTSMVVKDPGTGVYAVANQPSDLSTLKLPVRGERPVADLVGIRID